MTEVENLIWEFTNLKDRLRTLRYYLLHFLPDYDPEDYRGEFAKGMVSNIREIILENLSRAEELEGSVSDLLESLSHLNNAINQLEEFFEERRGEGV